MPVVAVYIMVTVITTDTQIVIIIINMVAMVIITANRVILPVITTTDITNHDTILIATNTTSRDIIDTDINTIIGLITEVDIALGMVHLDII